MEILRLCDGDVASLLELSSSERELSDLFFNISRLNDILSTVKTDILQPLESIMYLIDEIDEIEGVDSSVLLNPFYIGHTHNKTTSSKLT